jgi:hypothetical protein
LRLEGRYCRREGVTLPASAELDMTAAAKLEAFEPIKHEERPFDLADFLQRQIDLILPFISGQFAQHHRGCDMGQDVVGGRSSVSAKS